MTRTLEYIGAAALVIISLVLAAGGIHFIIEHTPWWFQMTTVGVAGSVLADLIVRGAPK